MITPVILCGGSGTRLWPLSRKMYPKQLLVLTGDKTLLQQTVLRVNGKEQFLPPVVICNEEHRFMVAEQLREVEVFPEAIILEPSGRNTAPATALAAFYCLKKNLDSTLLILPSDHIIEDGEGFYDAVMSGFKASSEKKMVTFGVVPSSPETGFGYIRRGSEYLSGIYLIEEFIEKPDVETAIKYIKEENCFWNSGMFMFNAAVYLHELENNRQDICIKCSEAMEESCEDLDFIRPDRASFEACPEDSIDYAVMENSRHGVVIPIDVGWNDIGSWSALWDTGKRDDSNNVVIGDVLLQDVEGSFVHASDRLVAAVGLRNSIIVETADAVLVADRDSSQDVKRIVNMLTALGRNEAVIHRRVYRPWGFYESIMSGERFQVKLITVKPGAKLSLQKHHHRAEHWIVVRGTAMIRRGEEQFVLTENESTYIPLGTVHQLENPGVIPLDMIEVQSGSYLGEDDIVRLEDIYGRSGKN